ncbi:MAG: restriction endonuclease subunit S [Gammaproteobacteria bacterium]|nr:restriction endonuclease subunit S [Gammaproteobacteria bacterium]
MVKADCFRFRLDPNEIVPEFAAYQLSANALAASGYFATGSTRSRMNLSTTAARKIALPPVAEQHVIVSFLNHETAKFDAMVAKKERLLELFQEKRTALITRAVTKGLDLDVPMKDSGVDWLGEIPSHWEMKRVAELALSLQTGPFGSQLHAADYITGGVPVINPADLISGTLVPDLDRTVDEPTAIRLGFHKLLQGDILFARRGDVGRCSLVGKQHEGWLCGTGCLRMRPCPKSAESSYLLNLLSTQGVGDWLGNESVGSTMQNLNTSIIGAIPVAVPGLAEQRRISEFLDHETTKVDALMAKVHEAVDRFKELRTALIAAAVTGKIDVRETLA